MAGLYPVSQGTAELLERFPPQGETHRWLARVAAGLRGTFTEERCVGVLRRLCEHVRHRRIPEREIAAAVRFAYGSSVSRSSFLVPGCEKTPTIGSSRRATYDWPAADGELIERVILETAPGFDAAGDSEITAEEALLALFESGDLLCAGATQMSALVRPLAETVVDAGLMQFVVPNPMKGAEAVNKAGERSARCQANVKERRYLVAEFDLPGRGHEAQARLVTALGRALPCCMVVDSGGKSLHAWFAVRGMAETDMARFFGYACGLGADRSRWDPCGWLRMPGGLRRRDEGAPVRQRIVYFEREHVL
jgi:hypothetical protein